MTPIIFICRFLIGDMLKIANKVHICILNYLRLSQMILCTVQVD